MTIKLLYIEDNSLNMRLVSRLLKHTDFEMIEAMDGITGLRVAQQEKPDIILVDINLPGISGIEVVMRLRQNKAFYQTPIIAVTAYSIAGNVEEYLKAGFDAFLAKPLNRREFHATLAEQLDIVESGDLAVAV